MLSQQLFVLWNIFSRGLGEGLLRESVEKKKAVPGGGGCVRFSTLS